MNPQTDAPTSSRRPAPDPASAQAQTRAQAQEPDSDLDIWSSWLTQAAEAGTRFAELAALEIRLAVGDSGRLLLLVIVALPVAMLAWLGFCVLTAWLVAHYSASVAWGLGAFLGIQLATLCVVLALWQRYKRSLKLPLTRQYLHAFMGGLANDEARTTDSRNPGS